MNLIFQFSLLLLIALSFLMVVGVPVIFASSNNWNENKVGRIDENGNINKGSNWWNERKTGRIDSDGNINKGSNRMNEKKTGRTGE